MHNHAVINAPASADPVPMRFHVQHVFDGLYVELIAFSVFVFGLLLSRFVKPTYQNWKNSGNFLYSPFIQKIKPIRNDYYLNKWSSVIRMSPTEICLHLLTFLSMNLARFGFLRPKPRDFGMPCRNLESQRFRYFVAHLKMLRDRCRELSFGPM